MRKEMYRYIYTRIIEGNYLVLKYKSLKYRFIYNRVIEGIYDYEENKASYSNEYFNLDEYESILDITQLGNSILADMQDCNIYIPKGYRGFSGAYGITKDYDISGINIINKEIDSNSYTLQYLKEELASHINMLETYRDDGYEKFINKFGITLDEEFGTIYEIDETGGRIGRMWNI